MIDSLLIFKIKYSFAIYTLVFFSVYPFMPRSFSFKSIFNISAWALKKILSCLAFQHKRCSHNLKLDRIGTFASSWELPFWRKIYRICQCTACPAHHQQNWFESQLCTLLLVKPKEVYLYQLILLDMFAIIQDGRNEFNIQDNRALTFLYTVML